jgi:hypothetical protein
LRNYLAHMPSVIAKSCLSLSRVPSPWRARHLRRAGWFLRSWRITLHPRPPCLRLCRPPRTEEECQIFVSLFQAEGTCRSGRV